MTCNEVLEALSDFIDGELDASQRERVVDHLRGCNWCETFGGRFAAIVKALRRELQDPQPLPPEVLARLRKKL